MSPRPHNKARPVMQGRPIGSKATTPSAEAKARGRNNGGAASTARKNAPTPAERWAKELPGVLERFKADMALRYQETSRDETGE